MLGVTTIGGHSHVGSQALGEDRQRVLVASLPKWSAKRLKLISYLLLRLEFMILFQHVAPDVTVQWVQIWRA